MREQMTPSRVLEEYDIVGRKIPEKLIREMREKYRALEAGGAHVWKMLCEEVTLPAEMETLEAVERKIAEDRLWVVQGCSDVLLEKITPKRTADYHLWDQRITSLITPEDFLKFFSLLGIFHGEWRSSGWLQQIAKLPTSEGGVHINLSGLAKAILKSFHSYPNFVAWMDGKEKPDPTCIEIVQGWMCPADALQTFTELGIPNEKWRSSEWLVNKAKLPSSEGGIGVKLAGLKDAIQKRFHSHRAFVAWMDGKEKPTPTFVEIVQGWKSPADALKTFVALGIPNEKWRSSEWLAQQAKLPTSEGGIGVKLRGFEDAIQKRFHSHPLFVAAMDGRLPFNGFTSEKQAHQYLRREILRLRESGNWIQEPTEGNHITKEEWDEVTKEEYYWKNPVVRAVTDYINSRSRES